MDRGVWNSDIAVCYLKTVYKMEILKVKYQGSDKLHKF